MYESLLRAIRPRSEDELDRLLRVLLGLRMPRRAVVAGHDAPMAYLWHSYTQGGDGPADCVVWANRGGGKTYLGAVATLLDLMFRPGVQVRILAGSLEQSSRMYRYLHSLVQRPGLRSLLASEPTLRRIAFRNHSAAEVLAQSEASVRGLRVHKLRCDEVELFEKDIWRAAQMVTRSEQRGGEWVRGSVEVMSTMHRPFGLMRELLDDAAGPAARRVFRWNAMDVIERCPPTRSCEGCPLWIDCQGRARQADDFMAIDDLIVQRRRTDNATWDSEMLCERPQIGDCVYAMFDPAVHVQPTAGADLDGGMLIAGMDFGMRSPLVMLWAVVQPDATGDPSRYAVRVIDEYVANDLILQTHLDRIRARPHGEPRWIGVDPAGGQRNEQTGLSNIEVMRRQKLRVRWQRRSLEAGIHVVRRRLEQRRLTIDPRCVALIRAMTKYHFDTDRPHDEKPVKDGPDHLCDALRYMLICLEAAERPVTVRTW